MKLRLTTNPGSGNSRLSRTYKMAGIVLILAGLLLGLDQILKTRWLTFVIFPLCGIFIISFGYYVKSFGWMITGCLLAGLGGVGYFLLNFFWPLPALTRVGYAAIAFGISWLLITPLSYLIHQKIAWWALIPAGVLI